LAGPVPGVERLPGTHGSGLLTVADQTGGQATGEASIAILNYLVLPGGPDVLRCDAYRLTDCLPDQCRRLNATYTHILPSVQSARADLALSV